jgi:hypothetical protein
MTRTLHILIFAAVLLAVAMVGDAWLSARRSASQLTATIATQNKAIQGIVESENLRDTRLAAALATIADQKRRVNTAQQAAAAIPSILPQLPLPVAISFEKSSPGARPDDPANPQGFPPAEMAIPQADLKPLYDGLQDCRVCALERDATKQDLADEQKKAAALAIERDAAIAAAHGGSRWSKLKESAKWLLIGAVAGVAAKSLQNALSTSAPPHAP